MTYKGGFHNSEYDGKGAFYHHGQKLFEGDYSRGQMIRGAIYRNGVKVYEGKVPPPEE